MRLVRHGSVTLAAEELHLTQSTVSRLIATLETQLGKDLFVRQKRRLVPTPAALSYQNDVAKALDVIQKSSMAVVANPEGGTVSLAVLPTFATRWLGPRMSGFFQSHPGIAVNMSTRLRRFDFEVEQFDAVIFFGKPNWPGAGHLKLLDECYTACAAPAFLQANPIAQPSDLAGLPRLRLETRPNAWTDWFAGQDSPPMEGSGMVMDQFSMMTQAAISGLGLALLPDYLAQTEIAEGRLVPVLHQAVAVPEAYWLAWPNNKNSLAPLAVLRDWLTTPQ